MANFSQNIPTLFRKKIKKITIKVNVQTFNYSLQK